jgi:hypothetical protein
LCFAIEIHKRDIRGERERERECDGRFLTVLSFFLFLPIALSILYPMCLTLQWDSVDDSETQRRRKKGRQRDGKETPNLELVPFPSLLSSLL